MFTMKNTIMTIALTGSILFAPGMAFSQQNQSPNSKTDTSIEGRAQQPNNTRTTTNRNFNNPQGAMDTSTGMSTQTNTASGNTSQSDTSAQMMTAPGMGNTQDGNYSGAYDPATGNQGDQALSSDQGGLAQAGQGRNWSWLGMLGLLGLLGLVGRSQGTAKTSHYRETRTTGTPRVSPS